ncbi:MAG: hypothetical protein SFV51_13455 [Bryobacteraceae bacterium]|nr:hypothetical protein [Bryobacteraceae bacterium]
MPGYLENYGAGEEKREKRLLRIGGSVLGALVLGAILYFSFRDYFLKRQVNQFLAAVQKQDLKTAYTFWGCTVDAPCKGYGYDRFLEDWGPKGANQKFASGSIAETERCGTGFIAAVSNGQEELALWVERETRVVGFAPWRECPEKKLRIRKWLRMKFGIG